MCQDIDKEELKRIKERRYLLSLSPLDLGREIAVLQEMVEGGDKERREWAEAELEKRLEIAKGLFEDEGGG